MQVARAITTGTRTPPSNQADDATQTCVHDATAEAGRMQRQMMLEADQELLETMAADEYAETSLKLDKALRQTAGSPAPR